MSRSPEPDYNQAHTSWGCGTLEKADMHELNDLHIEMVDYISLHSTRRFSS